MCFRLHFGHDVVTMNTASASIRQLVCAVFDRVSVQDEASLKETVVKSPGNVHLSPWAQHAYLT